MCNKFIMDIIDNCFQIIGYTDYKLENNNKIYDICFRNKYNLLLEKHNDTFEVIVNDNVFTHHLKRIICKEFNCVTFNQDLLFNIFEYVISIIDDPFQLCTVCAKKVNINTDKPMYCSDYCKIQYYSIFTDNIVTDLYKNDKIILEFLLQTAFFSPKSSKKELVFDPFPPMFLMNAENKDWKRIEELISKFTIEQLLVTLKIFKNDNEIILKYGKHLYGFIKFIIMSNMTRLKTSSFKSSMIMEQNDKLNNELMYFEVIHDIIKQNKFKTDSPEYLFHGSAISNWYSIMRNGLKNCSNTGLMLNGAAHGSGIYLSDSINMSYGYCTKSGKNDIYVLGVVQVIGDRESYKKTNNIFVVPQEENVLLKYIILIPNTKSLETVQKYFMTEITDEIKDGVSKFNSMSIKRVLKEFEYIQKKNPKYVVQSIDNDTKISWSILYKKEGKPDLDIQIVFTDGFPGDPPILTINKPKVKIKSNNIFDTGVICIQEISPKYWTPKIRIYDILNKLSEILDVTDYLILDNSAYDYNTVVKDYDKMLKYLNWY
jgi:ubiquitin-protein ligase